MFMKSPLANLGPMRLFVFASLTTFFNAFQPTSEFF